MDQKNISFREVFTPNDQPTLTYVSRDNKKIEAKLKDYIESPKTVVSICGPSKTGKTVLIRSVIENDSLIPLTGASIKSLDDFYNGIFSWMDAPIEISQSSSSSTDQKIQANGGLELNAGIAKLKTGGLGETTEKTSESETNKFSNDPIQKIVKEIGDSGFVLFIDDFHYIQKEVQYEVAKVIKALAEKGVKICTASVPHRNDDVVRANTELRGRLASIDMPEWDHDELKSIAEKGFEALNVNINDAIKNRIVEESFQSPQLVQALCMNLCRISGIRERKLKKEDVNVDEEFFQDALKDTSDFTNFSNLVELLHSGPKVHGMERKQFDLTDGTKGDVYRAILLAIKKDPPSRQFDYDLILQRVKDVCVNESPSGSSISGSLGHISSIATEQTGMGRVLEWDENHLTIIDPYFSFYLRSSDKLSLLKK
ncbi:hypothetical protein ACE4RV_04315 [Acetobacter persici]|uniref:hypothetical protein n=1 Tax=Acetobacter persici TaxID=1076596 RepID=UPI0036DF720C